MSVTITGQRTEESNICKGYETGGYSSASDDAAENEAAQETTKRKINADVLILFTITLIPGYSNP